jgi:hypothetical protein
VRRDKKMNELWVGEEGGYGDGRRGGAEG